MKLAVLLFSTLLGMIYAHCVHDDFIKAHPVEHHVSLNRYNPVTLDHRGREVSAFSGLRVHYHADALYDDLSSSPSLLNLMLNVTLPNTAAKFKEILEVDSVSGNLHIDRSCNTFQNDDEIIYCMSYSDLQCSEYGPIPAAHYSSQPVYDTMREVVSNTTGGVGIEDADIVVYVSAKHTSTCQGSSSTLAYATHCSQDQKDRPVAGYINFCPQTLSVNEAERLYYTTLHEVGHILGFSSALYRYYRFPNGNARSKRSINSSPYIFETGEPPATPDENTLKAFTVRGKSAEMLVMDNVVEKVKEHFDCNTASGLELEDQGGSGTAKSHPEMRMYYNDFMNGMYPAFPVISPTTLAVFEGTGWYKANYNKADVLTWGSKSGCNFLNQPCVVSSSSVYTDHFCTAPLSSQEIRCTQDLKGFGICNRGTYSYIDPKYRYFGDETSGGGLELLDFCPFYVSFSFDSSSLYPASRSVCSNPSGTPRLNARGENYGSKSKCVVNSLLSREYIGTQNTVTGGCFEMDCKVDYVRVLVGDTFVNCGNSESGNVKSTPNYKGSIVCPNYRIACPPNAINNCTRECGAHGSCDGDDTCICVRGWDGQFCNIYVGSAASIFLSIGAILIAVLANLLFL